MMRTESDPLESGGGVPFENFPAGGSGEIYSGVTPTTQTTGTATAPTAPTAETPLPDQETETEFDFFGFAKSNPLIVIGGVAIVCVVINQFR